MLADDTLFGNLFQHCQLPLSRLCVRLVPPPCFSAIPVPQLGFELLSDSRLLGAYDGVWGQRMSPRKSEESMLQRWRGRETWFRVLLLPWLLTQVAGMAQSSTHHDTKLTFIRFCLVPQLTYKCRYYNDQAAETKVLQDFGHTL